MIIQTRLLCAIAVSGVAALLASAPAQALTAQECSAKYQAAKKDGSLGTMKWNDFRKAECGADAKPAAAPTAAAPAAPAAPAEPKQAAPAAAPALPAGPAVYPNAVDPKYTKETPARRGCTPASTSIMPTRPPTAMAA